MNEISILNNWIISEFDKNNLVNTISIVPTLQMDSNKENVYPLVNIDMLNSVVQNDVIVVSFEITIVQQRDKRPVKTDSKLLNDTNYLDNVNETHSIAERFINVLDRQNNSLNIELDTISKLEFLKEYSRENLDGVQFTIDLSIPNIGTSC
ncbi:MAG: hypothetical protein RL311_351 [Bacteroidota bacterium]|jgi:hypothetical protein